MFELQLVSSFGIGRIPEETNSNEYLLYIDIVGTWYLSCIRCIYRNFQGTEVWCFGEICSLLSPVKVPTDTAQCSTIKSSLKIKKLQNVCTPSHLRPCTLENAHVILSNVTVYVNIYNLYIHLYISE